ncbi:hypothetical protein niasHT_020436 [Heterodera trifolii]|uniref:Uncharacterized protein n=1 Tax=Heterodera trifolii TaxID=157864 RepID=A0ABD2JGF5_9BILA
MLISKLVDVDAHFLLRVEMVVVSIEAQNGEEQRTLTILPHRKQCYVEVYCNIAKADGTSTVLAFGTGQKEVGTAQIHLSLFDKEKANKCIEQNIHVKIFDENKEKNINFNSSEFFNASEQITIDLTKLN